MRTTHTATPWWGLRVALVALIPIAALVWYFAGLQTLFWWVLVPFFLGVAGIRIGTALQRSRAPARAVDGTGKEHLRFSKTNQAEPIAEVETERITDGGRRKE
ncbi:hypothetical protein [Haladaptatus sp. DJG-WS-42]|uniref:hypothetical protein n=1 Tax=Haladaptatus sp. DJG-WS-42 TaxID=3120516 RepID=UPI0030CBA037